MKKGSDTGKAMLEWVLADLLFSTYAMSRYCFFRTYAARVQEVGV